MKPIYFDSQILEKIAKEKFCFPEGIMMENAAASLEKAVLENPFGNNSNVLIICGSGNNGGDGLALARRLFGKYSVYVFCVKNPKTSESLVQLKMTQSIGVPFLSEQEFYALLDSKRINVIVDCLFGTGFSGIPDEKSCKILNTVNSYECYKIACDIPSGIDKNGNISVEDKNSLVFKADVTVTMGALKTALFSDVAKDFVGKVVCSELGISEKVFNSLEKPTAYLIENDDIKLPYRNKKSCHKGNFGHSCVVIGEKAGAGVIAATSALKFGCGLATLCEKFGDSSRVKIPMDLMFSQEIPENVTSILVGSGFGRNQQKLKEVSNLVRKISKETQCSFVFDADLFYYEGFFDLLKELNDCKVILTPHPKELHQLFMLESSRNYTFEEVVKNRFELCKIFSEKYPNCVLVSKGANTYISYGDELFVCDIGSSALAKAGSGDILAGMCLSLLAQGYECIDAAKTAVYAHGKMGSAFEPNYGFIPSEIKF